MSQTPKFKIPDVDQFQQDISVDELHTFWNGRLSFNTVASIDIVTFWNKDIKLCRSHSGYLWSFIVYTGKETVLDSPLFSKNTPTATAIVLQLSEHLLHKGCTLWMDNYYNSPALTKFLKSCNTDLLGTVRQTGRLC